mmetsp:Transcript_49269/g.73333  ORF Transcript_49269/g.73333 Transcript_49269/m.73333 type:complete len:380 (+) Transcript_49269:1043-2182(+)
MALASTVITVTDTVVGALNFLMSDVVCHGQIEPRGSGRARAQRAVGAGPSLQAVTDIRGVVLADAMSAAFHFFSGTGYHRTCLVSAVTTGSSLSVLAVAVAGLEVVRALAQASGFVTNATVAAILVLFGSHDCLDVVVEVGVQLAQEVLVVALVVQVVGHASRLDHAAGARDVQLPVGLLDAERGKVSKVLEEFYADELCVFVRTCGVRQIVGIAGHFEVSLVQKRDRYLTDRWQVLETGLDCGGVVSSINTLRGPPIELECEPVAGGGRDSLREGYHEQLPFVVLVHSERVVPTRAHLQGAVVARVAVVALAAVDLVAVPLVVRDVVKSGHAGHAHALPVVVAVVLADTALARVALESVEALTGAGNVVTEPHVRTRC